MICDFQPDCVVGLVGDSGLVDGCLDSDGDDHVGGVVIWDLSEGLISIIILVFE